MSKYSCNDLTEALKVVDSTISKCEKIQSKFSEGTSQHTLLKNRIKAMFISKDVITRAIEERNTVRFSKEELMDALKPILSIISKCESGQQKHGVESVYYKRFQKIIDAMIISKILILDEIAMME